MRLAHDWLECPAKGGLGRSVTEVSKCKSCGFQVLKADIADFSEIDDNGFGESKYRQHCVLAPIGF